MALAAAIFRRSDDPETGVLALGLKTYSEGAETCEVRAGSTAWMPTWTWHATSPARTSRWMDRTALRIAARHLPDLLDRLLARAGVCLEQIDLVVRIRRALTVSSACRRRLGIPRNKLVNIFATHGDQVSASLPMALNYALERGMVGRGSLILLLGSAAGVTLGGAVLRL